MMVKSSVATLIGLIFIVENVSSRPSFEAGSDPNTICYSVQCPKGTVMCARRSEVSSVDSTKLNIEVQCYDENAVIIKSKTSTARNPFGPDVYYKGTELSATINLSPPFDELDDGDEDPKTTEIPKYKPKSEVEDLNSN